MRLLTLAVLSAVLAPAVHRNKPATVVQPNPNTERAGVLHRGMLTATLEAKETLWHLNGPGRPAMTIEAFAEPGQEPVMPGPLVRAPAGTELRLSIRNSLSKPLTFFMPTAIRGEPDGPAMDSVVVSPGTTGLFTTRATAPGNYVYYAMLRSRWGRPAGLLAGAVVIDTADARARDRVFVIMETPDSAFVACADSATNRVFAECLLRNNPLLPPSRMCGSACPVGRFIYTINGRSWPNTERIHGTVGDSLRWRVINASQDTHPMHLHGFYYRVDAFDGPLAAIQGRPAPGQTVVTQLMTPFSGMSVTWSPDRPGNWLFHCHFAFHLIPDSISAARDDPHMRDMVGLVLGTIVADRPGVRVAGEPTAARHIRLVAFQDSAIANTTTGQAAVPSMRFILEEHGHRSDAGPDFSPELDLVRGEPVSITVVNHLPEPTSVHWHGIEVQDSYFDGVPGFSGEGRHLTPAIAPGDSFVAHFTPRRAGTFMYHAHVDELWEQMAGLEGALIVRDAGAVPAPDDHVFFLKSSRLEGGAAPLEINGTTNPDTLVLHVGQPARLRLLNLSTLQTSALAAVRLVAPAGHAPTGAGEMQTLQWRPIAKDGADLPLAARAPRLARQIIGMGETYDFEYTPERPGPQRLEVVTTVSPGSGARPALLIAVPIRVE